MIKCPDCSYEICDRCSDYDGTCPVCGKVLEDK